MEEKRRIIFHIDVNSAYLSWEAAYRIHHLGGHLDLREVPSAVSGDMALRHGIILAKSIPAKAYGIQTGMTIPEAKERCPSLLMVPPNYTLYQRCSGALLSLLKEYTPEVEQYSIDEAFLDMSGSAELFGGAMTAAEEIRSRTEKELGFTVNIGISCNKVLAKMAGELKKPNRIHTMYPEEIPGKMWPLPVSELFFVGPATAAKLRNLGILTVGELAESDPGLLKQILKKQGEVVWAFANGYDFSEVETLAPPQKGYGNSVTVPFDVRKEEEAKLVLSGLAETVASRLREDGKKAGLLSVRMKDCQFRSCVRQMPLPAPTDITWEISRYAWDIFSRMWDQRTPVRHLGISAGKLTSEGTRQISLFETRDYEKLSRLDRTVDQVRRRYGIDALKRAAFLGQAVDHMSGGISREKRSVDYEKETII